MLYHNYISLHLSLIPHIIIKTTPKCIYFDALFNAHDIRIIRFRYCNLLPSTIRFTRTQITSSPPSSYEHTNVSLLQSSADLTPPSYVVQTGASLTHAQSTQSHMAHLNVPSSRYSPCVHSTPSHVPPLLPQSA
eukprot:510698_1